MAQQPDYHVEIQGPDGDWILVADPMDQADADNLYDFLDAHGLHPRIITWEPVTVRQGVQVRITPTDLPPAPQTFGESLGIFEQTLRARGIEFQAGGGGLGPSSIKTIGGGVSTATLPGAVAVNDGTGGVGGSQAPVPGITTVVANEVIARQASGAYDTPAVKAIEAAAAAGTEDGYAPGHVGVELSPGRNSEIPGPEDPAQQEEPPARRVDTGNLWADDAPHIDGSEFFKDQPDVAATRLDLPAVRPDPVQDVVDGKLLPGDPGYVQAALVVHRDAGMGTRISRQM